MRLFFAIAFLVVSQVLFSQSLISGTVADSSSKKIEFATVALLNSKDSSVVQSTLSDVKGKFTFTNIPLGDYILKTFFIGYKQKTEFINVNKLKINLPEIVLKSESTNLNEVTISTLKKLIEFKNGNIIVNIEDNPMAAGNSVFDLLSKLPGVTVDENNTIAIQGKEGVRILIDDRPQQLSGAQLINLLKTMNASSIEKIEVLKNPPLKYDAAGTAGLINIRTKKLKLVGFNGFLNYNFSQGFYGNHNGDISINYRGNKIAFYSVLGADVLTLYHDHSFYNKVVKNSSTTILDQKMDNVDGGTMLTGRMALDWFVNSKNTIGIKLNSDGGTGFEKNIGNNYINNNDLGFTRLRFTSYVNNPWQYSNINVNAEHMFDTLGTKLSFSSDYSPNFDLYNGTFSNWFLDSNANNTLTPLFYINSNVIKNDILSSKLDFIKTMKKAVTFESGVKATAASLISSYDLHNKDYATGELIVDTVFTNSFNYKEQVLAGYVNFTKEWEKLSVQGGLRAENTHVFAESKSKSVQYTREYLNLFPALNLQYSKNENHIFQFNYNRRINRPNYNSFNPFRNRQSVFMSIKGNPNLVPEYSNTFELSHSYKGVLSNSISYSIIDHFLLDLTLLNDSSKEVTAYVDNLDKANKYGYSLFFNKSIRKWWTTTLNANASYLTCEGKLIGQDYTSIGYFYLASFTNQFLVKSTKIEINARYIGPRFNGVWNNGPKWGVFLAVKKTLLKEKLNVVIAIDDVFFTMIGRNKINVQNQDWAIRVTNDSRRFRISLNYTFGKTKIEERENSSNEEEKNRLGK